MSKPTIHFGLALATDHWLPSQGNVLAIAAVQGEDVFKATITPQIEGGKQSKYWQARPNEFAALQSGQVSLEKALRDFRSWIERYHGTHVAIATPIDFWWITSLMLEEFGKCSFGPNFIDIQTLRAVRSADFGLNVGQKEPILPWEQAQGRYGIVRYFSGLASPKRTSPSIKEKLFTQRRSPDFAAIDAILQEQAQDALILDEDLREEEEPEF